jgi:branched-chain amino acid transport system ATP-binding protein
VSELLRLTGVQTRYGASQVLFGIDFEMRSGEAVALLGRNGMGKSTLIRSVIGMTPPHTGTIEFRGTRIERLAVEDIARLGVAIVPEGRQIFPNLTVKENLIAFNGNRSNADNPWTLARVLQTFPRLRERLDNMGDQLSGGEQQMLAIGRALMTNPHLLILDEATEGLAPLMREEIWRCLKTLKAEGLSMLIVDKYVKALMEFADHYTILERGRVVWHGDSAQLVADATLWKRYLGV